MIAAQLLAYYFTELKDDQVKKVSAFCFFWLHNNKKHACMRKTEEDKLRWRGEGRRTCV